jgi:phage terminase large subunit-like protein
MLVGGPGSKLFACAADRDQARLLADAAAGFNRRTPELGGAIRSDLYRITASRTGSVLEVLPSDHASAWGLLGDLFICDELCQWQATPGPQAFFEAISSATVKRDAAKLVITTTSGSPGHWSRKVYEHALASELWRVADTPGPCPWLDPAKLEDERQRLPESSFRRLHLNEWAEGEDTLASLDDLRACVTLDGPQEPRPGVEYVIGVDLGLKNDLTAVAVAHSERLRGDEEPTVGARVVLDRLQVWQGSRLRPVRLDDVEEWIAATSERYNRAHVVLDPWQAAGLAQRLLARGVGRADWSGERRPGGWGQVEEFTFSVQSVGRLAATLLLLIRNRALALPDDEQLLDELANLRLRETSPGVLRVDHDPGRHDDRATALMLAAHRLARDVWEQPAQPPKTEWPSERARVLDEFWQKQREREAQEDRGRPVEYGTRFTF